MEAIKCAVCGSSEEGHTELSHRYYSVAIPFTKENPTKWHPTCKTGPFSTITRGAFTTEEAAHAWARENIPGHAYTIKEF